MDRKTLWIDLDNLPHVQIFRPLIEEFQDRYKVIITARDHAFTCDLLDNFGLSYVKVGGYYGKNKILKIYGTLIRAFQLIFTVRDKSIDMAISHGSRSMVIAAKILGIPVVTMFDYEHVFSLLFEKFSDVILIPAVVKDLERFKNNKKYIGYPGFKEELYLSHFIPDLSFKDRLGIPSNKVIVLLRPPASTAHYHNAKADDLFNAIISEIANHPNVQAFLLPRLKHNHTNRFTNIANITVLDKPVSGLDLIYHADLVIGGGGTMNREAAIMGVPAYSIFQGKKGILDQQLEKENRMTFVENKNDIEKIRWIKKPSPIYLPTPNASVKHFIISIIDRIMTEESIHLK